MFEDLRKLATTVRKNALAMIYHAGSGHPGGTLSAVDILTYLYRSELRFGSDVREKNRDRFVLSKGHACPALYAVWAEVGLLSKEKLKSFRKLNDDLQGHPARSTTPRAEASTGSLAQGFSFAIGAALGLRHQAIQNRVYVMLGDGELQEGEIWEGAMFAGHYELDNLCAIIDYNKMQSDDLNQNIMTLEPLSDKWRAFNWHVREIDGHKFEEIAAAFHEAAMTKEKPTVIIAHTVKGKGVSYMEGSPAWHGSLLLSENDFRVALAELGCSKPEIEAYLAGVIPGTAKSNM
ncbi:MAG: transketolase [bacterium]